MKNFQKCLAALLCLCMMAGCGEKDKNKVPEIQISQTERISETEQATESTTEEKTTEQVTTTEVVEKINPREKLLISIDPGHQGSWVDMSATEPNAPGSATMKAKATSGTTGKYTGIPEYELTLVISQKLRESLSALGYQVIMTREDNDTAISNSERARLANEHNADVAVRIHANGSEDSSVNGALVLIGSEQNPYVGNLYDDSLHLGQSVLDAYCENTGMKNLGIQVNDTMTGINWSTVPVMILEMGFMSNEQDDRNMQNPDYQTNMVQGIVCGIENYFGLDGENAGNVEENSTLAEVDKCLQEEVAKQTQLGAGAAAYVAEVTDGASAGVNSALSMQAASLIKLYIAGAVYEEQSRSSAANLTDVEALVKSMLSVSDNDAANTLVTKLGNGDSTVGMQKVNAFCAAHNLTDTHMGRLLLAPADTDDNYTSVIDTASFLRSVYLGNLAGSEKILAYLKAQERTGKLPAGIPDGVQTANKTGELSDVENDAAIVFIENRPYVICVMTQNLSDTSQAREWMTELSKKVYDMMAR